MKKILIVRGKYINEYEMQNYEPLVKKGVKVWGVGSLWPIHQDFKFPLIKLASPADLPNFPYKMPILNRLFLGDAMWLFGLANKVKQIQPDVVNGRETYFYFTYQLAKLRAQGKIQKLVVTCSEAKPFNHQGIWRRKEIKAFVRQYADYFHTLTVKAKEALITEGVKASRIKVIHYGVNQNIFYPRPDLKVAKKLKILFVGRLVEEKGVRDLSKIFHRLKNEKVPFELKIVGQGPLAKWLFSQGLEAKTYTYDQMAEIYRQADVLVSLSKTTQYWQELFGMNLIEAMSSAVVPIAYASGSIPEVVKLKKLLVSEGDWPVVAKRIIEFYSHKKRLLEYKKTVLELAEKEYNADVQALKIKNYFLNG